MTDIINIITEYYNYSVDINSFTNETKNKEKINDNIKEKFKPDIEIPIEYEISFFNNKDIQEALKLYHFTNNNSNVNNDKKLIDIITKYDYYLTMKNKSNSIPIQEGGNSKINLLGKRRNIINKKGKLCVTIKGELVSLKKAKLMHIKYVNNKIK